MLTDSNKAASLHTNKSYVEVLVKRTEDTSEIEEKDMIPLPMYQSEHASGMDLHACVPPGETWLINGGEVRKVSTGISVKIPEGYEGQIRSRSGLAAKYGLGLMGGIGTVDADYTGTIYVTLINTQHRAFLFKRGDRIAQMVIKPITKAILKEVDILPGTTRGTGGYGSTGGVSDQNAKHSNRND